MRLYAFLLLFVGILYSLTSWKKLSNSSWDLCSELSVSNIHTLTVGAGWYSVKGGMRNRDPLVCAFGECKKLSLDVFLPVEVQADKQPRKVVGVFQCPLKNHNPSEYFFLRFFDRPQLIAKKFRIEEFESGLNFIDVFSWKYRKEFPLVDALVQSVWKGTTSGFPDSFVSFYRLGGLSHILAVSGTHVMILFYLLNKLFSFFVIFSPSFFRKKTVWFCRLCLLFVAGFLLCNYSPGNAPVYRVLFFLITIGSLNYKMWKSCPVQVVCSGLALLLLYEPSLLLSESFWLSAMGAFFLSFRNSEKVLNTYFLAVVLIPLFMAPLVMHVFGQLSLSAPLVSLIFSPLWDVVLIPIGYLSPFLAVCAIGRYLISFFERFMQLIASFQETLFPFIEKTQVVTLRLSLFEGTVLCISIILLVIAAPRPDEKAI